MLKKTLLVVTLAGLTALVLAPTVQSEEAEAVATPGLWMFDVRLVRVDAATPEDVETPAPWEAGGSCIVDTAWPELLSQLKARGKTTLLLDQRVTARAGSEALISNTLDRQIQQLTSRDLSNERWGVAPVVTGGTAKLRMQEPDRLQYQLEARWAIRSNREQVRPIMCATKWMGDLPAVADGRTLILSYREQIETWGDARVGTEVHAFVTLRRLMP